MDDVINMVQAMSTSKRSLSAERKEETTQPTSMQPTGPAYIGNLEVQKKVGSLNIHQEEGKAAFAMPELTVWPPKDKVVEEEVEIKEVEDKE